MLTNPEFWKAITPLAWPIVAIIAFFKLLPVLKSLLTRENLTLKVAGMEVSVKQATESLGTQVTDLQEKLAAIKLQGEADGNLEAETHEINKDRSLLWVDDYPSNNAFIIDKLRKNGIDITLSIATDEAISIFRSNKFGALITDLGRTERGEENRMAGLDLIKKIREVNSDVPILVFAGERGIRHSDELLQAGATRVTASGVDVMAFVEQYLGAF